MEKNKQSQVKLFLSRMVRQNPFALAVITIILSIIIYFINNNFLATANLRGGIFIPMVVPGVMLVAVGPLLIGGGIDLSCAAQAAFASVVFAQILTHIPSLPWPVALILTLLCGAIFGFINIFLTNVLNFMPFIATIGMASVYRGVATAWTLMNDVAINNQSFNNIGGISYFNKTIPMLFVFMLVLVLIYTYILSNTRFGRSIYMVGGNQTAARLAGLDPSKIRAILFINSGMISALAGVVWAAQQKRGNATNLVDGAPNFVALTSVILGGTAFAGGGGGVLGGVIALLMVQVFDNGLTILAQTTAKNGQPLYGSYVNMLLKGLILIVALMLDYVKTKRAQSALVAAAMSSADEKETAKTVV